MKAEFKPRIDLKNRTKLETVIPLDTPYIIFIDPSDVCNFQCDFCPTGDRELMKRTSGRGYGNMSWEKYVKIIDSLADFPNRVKVIRLYKDGEPLLNPRFADMVKYAKESGYCDRVDTTTNASLLTPEKSDAIIAAGLDRINISIEGVDDETYRSFSHYNLKYSDIVENVRYFYEHKTNTEMIVKINGDVISEEQKNQFLEDFGDITDGIFIESIMDCWPTFELEKVVINDERGIYGQEIREVQVCPYVFYSIAVNSNGTVSLCFLDWHRKLVIGDIERDSLKDLWNGKEMQEFRKMFLEKRRKEHYICSVCGQMKQGQPDDVDQYADVLLERCFG